MVSAKAEKILCIFGSAVIIFNILFSIILDFSIPPKLFFFLPVYGLWIFAIIHTERRIRRQIETLCAENKKSLNNYLPPNSFVNSLVDACSTFKGKGPARQRGINKLIRLRSQTDHPAEKVIITYILFTFYRKLERTELARTEGEFLLELSPHFASTVSSGYTFT